MSEFTIIEQFFKKPFSNVCTQSAVTLGIGDDAAIINPQQKGGGAWVVCVDTLVEGVHFLPIATAEDIAYKSLAVNISDFAAMGATPYWMTLSLTLPHMDKAWLARFSRALYQLASQYGIYLVGGDTTRGPLSVTVQLMGLNPTDHVSALLRSGAKPNQIVAVSGDLGGASLGLDILQERVQQMDAGALSRLNRPEPRLALGHLLRGFASSCIDISDGLVGDLLHICRASAVSAIIDVEQLPIYEGLYFGVTPPDGDTFDTAVAKAVTFGDDYELLFTIDAEKWKPFMDAVDQVKHATNGLKVTQIGTTRPLMNDRPLLSWRRLGQPYQFQEERLSAYEHFT